MRAVVQRVTYAKVLVEDKIVGQINTGLLLFLGVGEKDSIEEVDYLVDKVINLRIFADEDNKMNLSLLDIEGDLLVVSQFTLYGDVRKGRRPSFTNSAHPILGEDLYNKFIEKAIESGINVQSGEFGANMQVELVNDGPVTILLDSGKLF